MKKAEPVQIVHGYPNDAHPVVDHVVEDDFASGEECMLFATEHADDDSLGHFILGGGDQPRHFEVKFHRGPRFVQREAARYVTMQKGHGQYQRFIPGAETTGFKVPTWYGLAIADVTKVRVWNLHLFSTEGDRDTALVLARTTLSACVVLGVSDHEASDNVMFYGGDDEETRRFFTHLSVEGLQFEREGLYERPWATGKVQLHHTGPYRLVVPESRSERMDDIDEVSQEMDQMAARIIDGRGGERPAKPDDHATTEGDEKRLVPFINVPPSKMATGRNVISVGPFHKSGGWADAWRATCVTIGAPLIDQSPRVNVGVWSSRWTIDQLESWSFWEVWQTIAGGCVVVVASNVVVDEINAILESETGGTERFMRPLVLVGQNEDGSIEYEQRNQCHFDRFPDADQWEFISSTEGAAGTRPWRAVGWSVVLDNFAPGERWRLSVWSSRDQEDAVTIDDDSTRVEPVVEKEFVLPTELGWYWTKTFARNQWLVVGIVRYDNRYWTENGRDDEWTSNQYGIRAQRAGLTFERIPYPSSSSEE